MLLIIFTIGGITLKLADIYGEKGNNIFQYVFAIVAALSFSLLIANNSASSSIMLGIIIGVTISKKVNRLNLVLGLILTLLASIALGFEPPIPWLLTIVSGLTLIDEFCHDKFSEKKRTINQIFQIRPLLKLTMIFLAIASLVEAIYSAGFLSFDFAYDASGWLINKQSKQK